MTNTHTYHKHTHAHTHHTPGGVIQTLMPLLMPQDSHTDELLRHHDGLLDQVTAVLPHVLQNALSSFLPAPILTLSGHCQWVHQCLHMVTYSTCQWVHQCLHTAHVNGYTSAYTQHMSMGTPVPTHSTCQWVHQCLHTPHVNGYTSAYTQHMSMGGRDST